MGYKTTRLHYIDWLRVLAFITLIVFHCAVPFVEHYSWEINNDETSPWITRIIWWTHQWRLPLLFFIAGVGVRFSLRRRSIPAFFGERILRLLLPLAFAIFFITPIQVYFEWLQKGRISQDFFEFYPQVYEIIPYPDGAFTWSHMWFVAYLFVFTVLLLPLFSMAKVTWFNKFDVKLNAFFSNPIIPALFAMPFVLYFYWLYIDWPEQGSLISDWFVFSMSITFYLFGFLLGKISMFWEMCLTHRRKYLSVALLLALFLIWQFYWEWEASRPDKQDIRLYIYGLCNGIHIWIIILTTIGYSMKYLNFSNKYVFYLNKAVYPFYILHQAVIVASGYYILQLDLGIGTKLLLLLISCIIGIWVPYHFIIRNTLVTRVLFGMKWNQSRSKKSTPVP